MTRHEILVEDIEFVQEGMKRLGTTKEDIWQDATISGGHAYIRPYRVV